MFAKCLIKRLMFFDDTHIIAGSKIQSEILKYGVVIYEK